MGIPLIAMFLCGASSVTSNSRWGSAQVLPCIGQTLPCIARATPWQAKLSENADKHHLSAWLIVTSGARARELLYPQYLLQCQDVLELQPRWRCARLASVEYDQPCHQDSAQCSPFHGMHLILCRNILAGAAGNAM